MPVNGHRGEVVVEIGETPRIIQLDWAALARLRDAGVDNLFVELDRVLVEMDVERLAVLLSIALQKHWPDVSAEAILDASPPFHPIYEALSKAVNLAFFGTDEPPVVEDIQNPLERVPATGSPPPEAPASNGG